MIDLARELADAITIDFESDPIRGRPDDPPAPCGVALKYGDAPARYYAWGHHGHENPETFEIGLGALRAAWSSGRQFLGHNMKFDLAVAVERLGLPMPAWDRVHDTIPLLFLLDPRAETYSLKPSAERLLNWPSEERDAVVDWLVDQQPIAGVKLSRASRSNKYAGAYIAWAPPALVGPYCCGDVDRTRALALWAAPQVERLGMVDAYDRERRIMPVVMDMERRGVRVAVDRLADDLDDAEMTMIMLDAWLRDRLGVGDSVNLDSGDELAAALVACGVATRAGLGVTTKSGKLQTNKDAFARGIVDPQLKAVLRYRGALLTAVQTFMVPWFAVAERAGGRIFTTWNSTRTSRDDGNAGARTGRFSSNPNFQNCFSADTEILTEDGWTCFDALKRGRKVAQYRAVDGRVSFATPYEYVEQKYTGKLLHLWTRKQIDLLLTPDHELLLQKRGAGTKRKVAAADVKGGERIFHAGTYTGHEDIAHAWITLLCAAQADGSWTGTGWAFGFIKTRKARRLRQALREIGAPFDYHRRMKNGKHLHVFYIHKSELAQRIYDVLGASKHFGAWLLTWDGSSLDYFLNEVMLWGGLSTRKDCYASNEKINADWVQIVAILRGRKSRIIPYRAKSGNINWWAGVRWCAHSWTTNLYRRRVHYTGKVYCVRVPDGNIIVRRCDRVAVVGNCPKKPPLIFRGDSTDGFDDMQLSEPPFVLPPLPRVRSYMLPEVGHVLVGRDFASQELRVMAHYEDDAVAAAYRAQPDLDLHQHVADTLAARGLDLGRRRAKSLHFAVIYGVGVGHLAELLGCSVIEARAVLDAYYYEFPSVKRLSTEVRARWRSGQPVRTWGGRLYHPEPPRLVDGRLRGWEYKAINVLVQGSSADLTKEAMIAYYAADDGAAPLLLSVHDELVVTAPLDDHTRVMDRLRDAMNADRLDVPMRSDGYVGPDWERKTKLKDASASPPEDVRPPGGKYVGWVTADGVVTQNNPPPLPK